jgi:predicted O-linked N-acetylglucosamine transferase (SPINDLY family)
MRPQSKFTIDLGHALDHHRAGRLTRAETLYRRVLTADSRHPKALYSLGLLALQTQRNEVAAELFKRAVDVDPNSIACHFNLGEAYRRLGRRREAVESLAKVLSLKPDFSEGFYNLALVLKDNGELKGAITYFERATDLNPAALLFQQALAGALQEFGDWARAVGHQACAWLLGGRDKSMLDALVSTLSILEQSEAADELRRRHGQADNLRAVAGSIFAEAAHQRALVFEGSGDTQNALAQHEIATYAQPDEFLYQSKLAGALRDIGALERAIGHYHCALALMPQSVETLISLSAVLKELGRSDGAAAASQRALDIEPECAMAHASLAAARVDQQRNEEAIASCRRAIDIDPTVSLSHFQLGYALVGCGEIEQAIDCFRRTIDLNPTHHVAHSNIVLLLSYVPGVSAEAIGEEAKAWARLRADSLAQEILPHANDRAPGRRLRIGYVSPDLRDHSVATFLLPLLQNHNRSDYEVICYASMRHPDAVTGRLRIHTDGWRDIASIGDAAVADLVREDGVDVLVDLAMHSAGGRPLLFARKPAPVQICWLAYAGTTGLSTMDYRVTDPYLDPPGLEPGWCTEKPLVLPDSYWCYCPVTPAPYVNALPALTSGQVTFGSLHSFHKIRPGVIALWARVLRSVQGSRLVLYAPTSSQGTMLREFEKERVDSSRIEFLPWRPRHEYLAAYHRIDVSLDTFPFNGATTSLEAFYMGVPVLSLLGRTPVGRAGLSIATNLGLAELVARSDDDYIGKAVELTHEIGRLSQLRAGLRDRMERSPLMDAARFACNLETAYRTAWKAWCASDSKNTGAGRSQVGVSTQPSSPTPPPSDRRAP